MDIVNKPKVLKDTIEFRDTCESVEMSFSVEKYYGTTFKGELEVMETLTMRIKYSKKDGTLEFENADDFYGQGHIFTFDVISLLKEFIEGLGLEVN